MSGRPVFPLKHVLVYAWELRTAKSLDEIVRRLEEARFYVVRPREDIIVMTSLARPGAVVLIMIERGPGHGDLIVVQMPEGPYSYEDLLRAVPVFARIAGIRLRGLWPKAHRPAA